MACFSMTGSGSGAISTLGASMCATAFGGSSRDAHHGIGSLRGAGGTGSTCALDSIASTVGSATRG
jgi:hypothetical protein